MTKNEIKFVPVAPKTYEVRYIENQNQEQVKKTSLSAAARVKVVNRSGSNYLSSRAETDIGESIGYGPMANDDNRFYCYYGDCRVKVGNKPGEYCSMHSNVCLKCSDRIPSGYNYCPNHINACTGCSKRISSSETDCSTCLEKAREEAYKSIMRTLEKSEREESECGCQ